METVIDSVRAFELEVGDRLDNGLISNIYDSGDDLIITFEELDEPLAYDPFEYVDLLGMVYDVEV